MDIHAGKRVLGIDESGKGDFFGPLVIAGVLADDNGARRLLEKGIKDSKKISDNRIRELSKWIADSFVHTVVLIGPGKYNQLYRKIGNLNRLLAWGHSRVIENIAAANAVDLAVSDKFGRRDSIENALMEKGRDIELVQRVRGESITQVAAASILARARFVEYMRKLSGECGMTLPLGAGDRVDAAARELVARSGREVLEKTAKIHFKNYRKVLE
ncbi:MAG: ribonuclease HIII [Candidatus Zixiibacteriota bacterium]|nr:MAG: ribonuclease HIII [candidate division Zixibacteria bacterium]